MCENGVTVSANVAKSLQSEKKHVMADPGMRSVNGRVTYASIFSVFNRSIIQSFTALSIHQIYANKH